MKEKILMLQYSDNNYFAMQYKKENIDVENILRNVNKFFKILRLINLRLGLPLLGIWYGSWKKRLENYSTIIIYDNQANINLPKYIHRKNPKIRIIFWYWNSVSNSISPDLIDDSICEKWTFDHKDAVKYNMKENTQYYFEDNDIKKDIKQYENDVFFVGINKDRKEILNICKKEFSRLNIKYKFVIAQERKSRFTFNKKYNNYIPYEEVIENILKSKAILDIVNNEKQNGLTLRPLEALFLKRKLITTNNHIMEYDFYNKNNIFILGKDDISKLPQFLSTQYIEIDNKIIEKYKFKNWLKRFFE